MDADLDTLATALYVSTDELLKRHPERSPYRPPVGWRPAITDAEMVTLAVMQALLGFTSEARWLRYARAHLHGYFPYLPGQPGYNKRLRALSATLSWLTAALAKDTSLWTDDVWVADSTPIECGRSVDTRRRSDLAGFAEYGYCASHSRYFWGLRLHLLCTLGGLLIGYALTGARAMNEPPCCRSWTTHTWPSSPGRSYDPRGTSGALLTRQRHVLSSMSGNRQRVALAAGSTPAEFDD